MTSECRLCLQIRPSIYIFDESKSLSTKIWNCCGLTTIQNDGLPDQICVPCETKLNSFNEFKETCVKNNMILNERHKEIINEIAESKISIDIYDGNDMPCTLDQKYIEDIKPSQISETNQIHRVSNNLINDSLSDVNTDKVELYSTISPITKIIKIENNIFTSDIVRTNDEFSCTNIYQDVDEKYVIEDIKNSQESESAWLDYLSRDPANEHLISTNSFMDCSNKRIKNNVRNLKELQCLHLSDEHSNIENKQKEKIHDNYIKRKHDEKSKIYKCDTCHKEYGRKYHLLRHLRNSQHPPNLKYERCNLCDAFCGSEIIFDVHMKRYHKSTLSTYECDKCGYKIKDRFAFINHIEFAHSNKTFVCDICNKSVNSIKTLKQHIRQHMYAVKKKQQCDKCDFVTQFRSKLIRHIECVHLNKTFECDICSTTYKCKYSLKHHVKRHIDVLDKKYRCDKCDYKTEFKQNFIVHVKCAHFNKTLKRKYKLDQHLKRHIGVLGKIFHCDKCDYKSELKWKLNYHIKIVHSNTTFQCVVCHKKFKNKLSFRRHVKRHASVVEKKHQCDKCDFKTEFKWNLSDHIENIHSNKTFECVACHKKLKKKSFRQHVKRHTNDFEKEHECDYKTVHEECLNLRIVDVHSNRNFECDVCHKNFLNKNSFKQHVKRHTNVEKKYKCDECDFKTAYKQSLNHHIKRLHLNTKI